MTDVIHQDERQLQISTPLGTDVLHLTSFAGGGALSGLFEYEVEMFSQSRHDLTAADLVGKAVDVSIALSKDDTPVVFNAYVRRFAAGGLTPRGGRAYRATLVPWLWFLSCRSNCRIFQEMSVREIVEAVLGEHSSDFRFALQGTYPKREYCVQYNETDFAFVSRLLEDVGIAYAFEHTKGRHSLLLTDDPKAFAECAVAKVEYRPDAEQGNALSAWDHQYEYRAGRFTHREYHFALPAAPFEKSEPTLYGDISDATLHELYEYPGGYTRVSKTSDPLDVHPELTKVRMLGEEAPFELVNGAGRCLAFTAGKTFTLILHDVDAERDKVYLLTEVHHRAADGSQIGGGGHFSYANSFRCIPADVRFVPRRTIPRPRMDGVQTATVTGPKGEEIWVDEFGRVKVQFHWDRDGKKDENSSCWIRVAQGSAGTKWGAVFHPRIGQEVVVSFVEGDPDRPLITGLVYNADAMPPFELPAKNMISGYKSRSTPDGVAENFNELTFDDKTGAERIYLHAERNFERVVENDDSLSVGFETKDPGSQKIRIFNSQEIEIGCSDAKEGSQKLSIYKDRTVGIETGHDTLGVDAGDRKVTIKSGDQIVKVSAGKSTLEAAQHIQLKVSGSTIDLKPAFILIKCGASKIKIDPAGITVEGPMIKLKGTAMVDVKAPMTKVSGDGMVMVKGGVVMIN